MDGPEFPPGAVIRTCLEAAASTERPIRVVEDGRLLGLVDRTRILSAVADTVGDRILGAMAGVPAVAPSAGDGRTAG